MPDINEKSRYPSIPTVGDSVSNKVPIPTIEFAEQESSFVGVESFQETSLSAMKNWMKDKLKAIPKEQLLTEQGKQSLAIVAHETLGIPLDEAYRDTYGIAAKYLGIDPREAPVDSMDLIGKRLQSVADVWNDTQTNLKINDLYSRYSMATDEDSKKTILSKIDQLKLSLHGPDVWADGGPIEAAKWVSGLGAGVGHYTLNWLSALGEGDNSLTAYLNDNGIKLKESPGMPSNTFVEGLSMMAATMAIKSAGDFGVVGTNKLTQYEQQKINEGIFDTAVAGGRSAAQWVLGMIPLAGEAFRQGHGIVSSDLMQHGLDGKTSDIIGAVAGIAEAGLSLASGGVLAGQLQSILGKATVAKILETAGEAGLQKSLLNGGHIQGLLKTGAVKLESTSGGQMLKYSMEQGLAIAEQGAIEAATTFAESVAFKYGSSLVKLTSVELAGMEYNGYVTNSIRNGRPPMPRDQFIAEVSPKYEEKYRDVFKETVQSFKEGALAAVLFTAGGAAYKGATGGFKGDPVTLESYLAVMNSQRKEQDIASATADTEQAAAFRAPDEKGEAPAITTGTIRVATAADSASRLGPGIRVSLEPTSHEATPVDTQQAVAKMREQLPPPVSAAFERAIAGESDIVTTPQISAWEKSTGNSFAELRTLAENIRDGDVTPETMAVAQRYGIESQGPAIATVDVKTGNFATLSKSEMKAPVKAMKAYEKAGFDGVFAGKELYVFKADKVLKTGEVSAPSLMHLDPKNSDVKVSATKVAIESNGKSMEMPVTHDNGAVQVKGEVSPFIANEVAKRLAEAHEGTKIEAESPVLQRAIEAMNPNAVELRNRIGRLETELENMKSGGADEASVLAKQVEIQVVKDALTTPTEAWKEPAPHLQTRDEYYEGLAQRDAGADTVLHETKSKDATTPETANTVEPIAGENTGEGRGEAGGVHAVLPQDGAAGVGKPGNTAGIAGKVTFHDTLTGTKDAPSVVRWVAENSENPAHRLIAERILANVESSGVTIERWGKGENPTFHVAANQRFRTPQTRAIHIEEILGDKPTARSIIVYRSEKLPDEATFLHEAIHAATNKRILTNLTPDLEAIQSAIKKHYAKKGDAKLSIVEQFIRDEISKDPLEVLTYGLTDTRVQEVFKSIQMDPKKSKKSIWTHFVESLAKAFGIVREAGDTAFSKTIEAFDRIIELKEPDSGQGVADAILNLHPKQAKEYGIVVSKATEIDSQRLAPNGKPSKLNAMQHAQVRTPEFKAWFGDWENDPANASKVVDENGEPMVVYHGTDAESFSAFDVSMSLHGPLIFTTPKKSYAEIYGSNVKELFVDARKIFSSNNRELVTEFITKNADEMLMYARNKESMWVHEFISEIDERMSADNASASEVLWFYLENEGSFRIYEAFPDLEIEIKRLGFDGIKMWGADHAGKYQELAVFSPTQIKSATDNSGAFDPSSPLITASTEIDDHEYFIRTAVEKGTYVPDRVLQDYLEKPWAQAEFDRRYPPEEAQLFNLATVNELYHFLDLTDEEYGTALASIPEDITALSGEDRTNALTSFWNRVNDPVDGRAVANKKWLETIQTDAGLTRWVAAILEDKSVLAGKRLPQNLTHAVAKLSGGKDILPADAKGIRNFAAKHPSAMREAQLEAGLHLEGGEEAMAAFKQEAEWQDTKNAMDEAAGVLDPDVIIQARNETIRTLANAGKATAQSLAEAQNKVKWNTEIVAESRVKLVNAMSHVADQIAGRDAKEVLSRGWEETKIKAANVLNDEKSTPDEKSAARKALSDISSFEDRLGRAEKALRAGAKEAIADIEEMYGEQLALAKDAAKVAAKEAKGEIKQLESFASKLGKSLEKVRAAGMEADTKLKDLKDAIKTRKTLEKLARSIMRPIGPKAVDVAYKGALRAMQELLDPKFRTAASISKRQAALKNFDFWLQAIQENATGKFKNVEQLIRFRDLAQKKSLNEWTVQELSDLADEFNKIYKQGKESLRLKERLADEEKDAGLRTVMDDMASPKGRDTGGPINARWLEAQKGTISERVGAWVRDPQRFFDSLGKDKGSFDGGAFEVFYRAMDKAATDRQRMEDAFHAELADVLVKNGFAKGTTETVNAFYKEFEDSNGNRWNADEVMDIYLKWKNTRSRAAMIGDGVRSGNRINQALHDELVSHLTTEQIAVADWILEYYNRPSKKQALREFHEFMTNTEFVDEVNYTPMQRIGSFKLASELEVKAELLGRTNKVKATIDKDFTKERVDMLAHNQSPVKLGALATIVSYQHHTAHYMSHAGPMQVADSVFANPEFKAAVVDLKGQPGIEFIKHYLETIKNPNIDKDPGLKFLRDIRANMANAFMAYNPKTILRQFPAVFYYTMELDNPLSIISAIKDVNVGWGEVWSKMEELSPQWKNRISQDPIMREIINGTGDNLIKMNSDKGMIGIGVIDKMVAGWGWWAVYKEFTAKIDPSTGNKFTEEKAASRADEAMNRTQQVNMPKDQAQLFSEKEQFKWLTMFTGPLNKVFNVMTYDLVNRPGMGKKLWAVGGLMAGGLVSWIMANGRPPESEEDWTQVLIGEVIGAPLPAIGGLVANAVYGFDKSGQLSPMALFNEAMDATKAVAKGIAKEYTPEEAMLAAINHTYGAVALATGAPMIEVRRVFQLGKDYTEGKEIDLRDLIGKNYGR